MTESTRWGPAAVVVAMLLATPAWAQDAPAEEAQAQRYTIVEGSSTVYALVGKKGAAAALAHDHAILATNISGSFERTPGNPGASEISVTVPVSGLRPDTDAIRATAGLPDRLSDEQRAEILGHMIGKDQLDGAAHSTMSFRSDRVSGTDSALQVDGTLQIRGVEHAVSVPLAITDEGEGLRATGSFQLEQSWFGYKPYSALLGALAVQDQVEVRLDVVLKPEA